METPTYDRQRIELLLNELEVALTFVNVAGTARDARMRKRDIQNAEEAYANATRMLAERAMYSAEDWRKIKELTSELKLRLHSAG